MLIGEATLNWKQVGQRDLLARFFEHGKMKTASDKTRAQCDRFLNSTPRPVPGPELDCIRHLHRVAYTFSDTQQQRLAADYDNAIVRRRGAQLRRSRAFCRVMQWTRSDILALIKDVDLAFQTWRTIREEPAAQAYLISLLGTPKGA